MAKHLRTLLCAALAIVCLGAKAGGIDTYTSWNFNDWATETYTAKATVENLALTASSDEKKIVVVERKAPYTPTFSDGKSLSPTNRYLQVSLGTKVSVKTTVPGTFYAKVKGAKSSPKKSTKLTFNKQTVAQVDHGGKEEKEITFTSTSAGTFTLSGNQFYIYAIEFVPSGK